MLITTITLGALLVLTIALALVAPRLRWRGVVRRRVMVVTVDERTIEGVLWARRGPLMVLRQAVVHDGTQEIPAAGTEFVLERARIAWVQVLS